MYNVYTLISKLVSLKCYNYKKAKLIYLNLLPLPRISENASMSEHDLLLQENRFKFPKEVKSEGSGNFEPKEDYEEAARIALRILASKDYGEAQQRFAGLIRQDPADPDLELVYGLELLWQHESTILERRPVAAFCWSPVNSSLLAVGYGPIDKPVRSYTYTSRRLENSLNHL